MAPMSTAATSPPTAATCSGCAGGCAPGRAAPAVSLADPNTVGQSARIQILQAPTSTGVSGPLVVRLTDEQGAPINDLDVVHTAKLHLFTETAATGIVSTLQDFQHVHPPEFLGDGTWRLPDFTWHVAGTQHLIANVIAGGVNTVAATSLDVVRGPAPAAPPADLSRGYSTSYVGRGRSDKSPSAVRILVRDPLGMPIAGNGTLYGANAHLIMFDTRGGGAAVPLFAHGHALNPASGGAFDVDMGVLPAGTYQGYLQFQSVDGVPVSVPVTIPWGG